jgi:hypothetical protein
MARHGRPVQQAQALLSGSPGIATGPGFTQPAYLPCLPPAHGHEEVRIERTTAVLRVYLTWKFQQRRGAKHHPEEHPLYALRAG